jgi:hypothetical protein
VLLQLHKESHIFLLYFDTTHDKMTETSYDQTPETFNMPKDGRAIRGSAAGLSSVPAINNFKTELPCTGNQNFSFHESLWASKFGEYSVPVSDKAGKNMWAERNEALLFGKCIPSMTSGNDAANRGDLTSWVEVQNNTIRPEFVPASNTGPVSFVNSIKTNNSVSSRGNQD